MQKYSGIKKSLLLFLSLMVIVSLIGCGKVGFAGKYVGTKIRAS